MAHPPDLSLVMPCYNEARSVERTVGDLTGAFARSGHRLQLVAVDNGSTDDTRRRLEALAATDPAVECVVVERNQGYGFGFLSGLPRCRAPWAGIVHADGQVDAQDVVRLYEAAIAAGGPAVAKVRRRSRMDGVWRGVVSTVYNVVVRMMWPRIGTADVNGTPRILPREALQAMHLRSRGWMLDSELMVKAQYMGLPVLEIEVLARPRSSGRSHVRMTTSLEVLASLVAARITQRWKRDLHPQ
jgi:glycosyltransferase involved in cell wall biosynthesis